MSARLSSPRRPLFRFSRTLLAACLAAGAGGCVEVEHSLTLRADGSGTLDFRYAVPVEEVQRWESLQTEAGLSGETANSSWAVFDEAAVRAAFAACDPAAITLQDVMVGEAAGLRTIRMQVEFRDLEALAGVNLLDRGQVSLQRLDSGDYLYQVRVGDPAMQGLAASPEAQAEMQAAGHDFDLTLRLQLPGEIVDTNGRRPSAQGVEWSVKGVTGEGGLLEAARNGPRVVFRGEGLNLPPFGQQHIRLPGPTPAPKAP